MNYAQSYTSEKYEAERQRKQELADRIKAWELSHSTIAIKVGILHRGGKTESLRTEIMELAKAYIIELEDLVGSVPIMITGPKTPNRY
jgi:hypothetical protein